MKKIYKSIVYESFLKKSFKKVLTQNVKADIIILVLERGQENKTKVLNEL